MSDTEGAFLSPAPDGLPFRVGIDWPSPTAAVVTPSGEMDLHFSGDLRRELLGAVADGAETVVVDLEQATFVDSMTLGVLLGIARRLRDRGGQLRIACADPNITRILEITLLDRVFAVYPSRETALE